MALVGRTKWRIKLKMRKVCTKCQIEKDSILDFHQDKYNGKYGGRFRCKRCVNEYRRNYNKKYPRFQKEYRNYLKQSVLYAYSDGKMICKCCSERNLVFLTLDHVNNDGKEDRLSCRNNVFPMLKRNNFPNKDRYQVLCFNCNLGKRINHGKCPHEK